MVLSGLLFSHCTDGTNGYSGMRRLSVFEVRSRLRRSRGEVSLVVGSWWPGRGQKRSSNVQGARIRDSLHSAPCTLHPGRSSDCPGLQLPGWAVGASVLKRAEWHRCGSSGWGTLVARQHVAPHTSRKVDSRGSGHNILVPHFQSSVQTRPLPTLVQSANHRNSGNVLSCQSFGLDHQEWDSDFWPSRQ